jgi:DNA processing protein
VPPLPPGWRGILDAIGFDPATVDQLVHRTGLTADRVCTILVLLESQDLACRLPCGRYTRRLPRGTGRDEGRRA